MSQQRRPGRQTHAQNLWNSFELQQVQWRIDQQDDRRFAGSGNDDKLRFEMGRVTNLTKEDYRFWMERLKAFSNSSTIGAKNLRSMTISFSGLPGTVTQKEALVEFLSHCEPCRMEVGVSSPPPNDRIGYKKPPVSSDKEEQHPVVSVLVQTLQRVPSIHFLHLSLERSVSDGCAILPCLLEQGIGHDLCNVSHLSLSLSLGFWPGIATTSPKPMPHFEEWFDLSKINNNNNNDDSESRNKTLKAISLSVVGITDQSRGKALVDSLSKCKILTSFSCDWCSGLLISNDISRLICHHEELESLEIKDFGLDHRIVEAVMGNCNLRHVKLKSSTMITSGSPFLALPLLECCVQESSKIESLILVDDNLRLSRLGNDKGYALGLERFSEDSPSVVRSKQELVRVLTELTNSPVLRERITSLRLVDCVYDWDIGKKICDLLVASGTCLDSFSVFGSGGADTDAFCANVFKGLSQRQRALKEFRIRILGVDSMPLLESLAPSCSPQHVFVGRDVPLHTVSEYIANRPTLQHMEVQGITFDLPGFDALASAAKLHPGLHTLEFHLIGMSQVNWKQCLGKFLPVLRERMILRNLVQHTQVTSGFDPVLMDELAPLLSRNQMIGRVRDMEQCGLDQKPRVWPLMLERLGSLKTREKGSPIYYFMQTHNTSLLGVVSVAMKKRKRTNKD